MSRTYRKLVGGRVPDGKVHAHLRDRFGNTPSRARATLACYDDNRGMRCEWCNSVHKRRQVPLDIMRDEMELLL